MMVLRIASSGGSVEGSAVALLSVVSLMDLDMVRFFVYYIIMLPY